MLPGACTGTGGNPELGEQAAQESYADLGEVVTGADMVRASCFCVRNAI